MRRLALLIPLIAVAAAWALARGGERPYEEPVAKRVVPAVAEADSGAISSSPAPAERPARRERPHVERRVVRRPVTPADAASHVLLPLVVEVVDAETGGAVEAEVFATREGEEPEFGYGKAGPRRFPGMIDPADDRTAVSIDVAPGGVPGQPRLLPDPLRSPRVTGPLSRFATSFRVIEPMRHEARVAVRVLQPDGTLVTSPDCITCVRYLGDDGAARIDPRALGGALLLRGFAHLSGEEVTVSAAWDGCIARGSVTLGPDAAEEPLLELRLEPDTRTGGSRRLRSYG